MHEMNTPSTRQPSKWHLRGLLSTAAVLAGAAMGHAAGYEPDIPEVIIAPTTPAAPTASDWSGFYGGLSLAHAKATVDWEDKNAGWFSPGGKHDFDLEGSGVGLQLGYNWQTPSNLVFGVELSGLVLDLEEDDTSPFFPASDTLGSSIRNPVALTAHLGYAARRWMPYVEAGVARAQVGLDNDDDFCVPVCEFDSEETHTGYVAGLGLGYKVSDRSAVGINYRYFDFGEVNHKGTTSNILISESFDTRATLGVVSVWYNYYLK